MGCHGAFLLSGIAALRNAARRENPFSKEQEERP
jgi:hypothetical protein